MSSFTLVPETICTDFDHHSIGWQKQNIGFQLANHGTAQRMDRPRQVLPSLCSQDVFRTYKVSILMLRYDKGHCLMT